MGSGVFSANPDIDKTAIMSWRMDPHDPEKNLTVMADGFSKAASMMIEHLLVDNSMHIADAVIFPILYTINQSIELRFKAIIRKIERIEGITVENLQTHDPLALYSQMFSAIGKHEKSAKGLQKHLKEVKAYLDEVCSYVMNEKNQPKMDFARYPFDIDGNPYFFASSTKNISVDLEKLLDTLNAINTSLDSLYTMFEVEHEYVLEMMHYEGDYNG